MIALDGESVDFSDLFRENNGLHEVDDNPVDLRFRSQIPEEIEEAQNEAENKKAGSGPAPLSCLPLHQPSIFPGYSSKRLNGERFPEKI